MKIYVDETAELMGRRAAEDTAKEIKRAVEERGECRLLLSTGASQFEMFDALVTKDLPWDHVVMFHLDEYVGMPATHNASFRKYLKERFIDKVHPKAYHFVNGEGDVEKNIQELTEEVRKAPIDVALIGIGENGHIAFNDPPADFDTKEAYKVVELEERCKKQQMGEGWFATIDEVPAKAITMTVFQMMQSRVILSVVPGKRKAQAIRMTLETPEITNQIPATKLREHSAWSLYLDKDSASLVDAAFLKQVDTK